MLHATILVVMLLLLQAIDAFIAGTPGDIASFASFFFLLPPFPIAQ